MEAIRAVLSEAATAEFWILFAVVAVSYSVKRLTGFGNTLVINGAFSFIKENRFTTPVELVWNIPANFWMAWQERRHLDLKLILPVCAFMVVGEIAGTRLLTLGDDAFLRSLLGLLLVALGLEMLFNRRTFKPNRAASTILALASGIVLGLFGIGAPIAAWFNKTTEGKEGYRSNLCFVFFVENIARTAAYGAAGILTWTTLKFSFLLFPAVAFGMAAGKMLDRRMDAAAVRRLVVVLLLASGTVLVARFSFGL